MHDHHHHDHPHDHEHHDHDHSHDHSHHHEKQTRWVVMLTIITMVLEIGFGYYANSMALTAEGWHMSTHVLAIGLTFLAYYAARKYSDHDKFSFKKEKILALSGFTSAIILQVIALVMVLESIERLMHPLPIKFNEAILVAAVGLVVNLLSAILLKHDHAHSDHNIRAAYLHVLADGITSLAAILALLAGRYFQLNWLDAAVGLLGAVVITSWALQLIKNSGLTLIDFKKK